jgi:hypothetical protein
MTAARGAHRSESDLVAQVASYLAVKGYRTYIDPDGGNYFDLVARRGEEIGLVEAKVSDARTVLRQALVRRAWGDWTAVAVGGARSAARLAERTRGTRAEPVGIWSVVAAVVTEVRPARPWVRASDPDPFLELRARFRAILDALDRGDLPAGATWDGVPRAVRRASGGRAFSEWRLDEISGEDQPPTRPDSDSTSSATRDGRKRSA